MSLFSLAITACMQSSSDADEARALENELADLGRSMPTLDDAGLEATNAAWAAAWAPRAPMLAEVEADAKFDPLAQPDGLVVEYAAGGHWHLSFSCVGAQRCTYFVTVLARVGARAVDTSNVPPDVEFDQSETGIDLMGDEAGRFDLELDTAPGDTLTVRALQPPSLASFPVSFLENGKNRGGFEGELSSPIQLVGNRP